MLRRPETQFCEAPTNRLTVCGIKLSLSLVVLVLMLRYRLLQQQTEQFVAGVMGAFDNPEGFLSEPLGVEVLHGWQLRPGDVLCSLHHPL